MPAKNDPGNLRDDPLWFKDAVIYELHVKAFADSAEDGIGDFEGLRRKLDYLQDLGVNTIWLLPFYPSPLKDDGYDVSDYTAIHPAYGTLQDFKDFLREAHRRGLRVITELILNHTSDQHPWFQRARRALAGTSQRDFYVWSEHGERYREARVIFKDFESSNWAWDPTARAYYWHRFYSHQPDLNYDNPQVQKAMLRVIDFWLGLGVDGLRLDAVPYLYERAGSNCENLPETYAFLRTLRTHIDGRYRNRLLLAEANQWPEDAVAYFGSGDLCHMAYHFPIMPRMFMALHMEDRVPVTEILEQTPAIPENCQWALFLRNHDELTLEMVTDEERDYMYRVYAQSAQMRINLGIRRRLAPLLGNHRRRIELMNGLLFSLPGTPIIYYGDEIGMGDNVYLGDRNGVRTPMQWSADRNAGFSRANPQRLYLPIIIDPEYHYETINVEAQQNNPHSLLWWMKRVISLRKQFRAFGRGSITFLHPENRRVLVFIRRYESECLLVVANLSRFVQYLEVDLAAFQGMVPVEMFGRIPFPPIEARPYFLTLGPHSFYWFSLEPKPTRETAAVVSTASPELPLLTLSGRWGAPLKGKDLTEIERSLPAFLARSRWFGGKALPLKSARCREAFPMNGGGACCYLTLVQVEYVGHDPETYALPLALASGARAEELRLEQPQRCLARVRTAAGGGEALLYDAVADPAFCALLLEGISRRRGIRGTAGEMVGFSTPALRAIRGTGLPPLEPTLLEVEQSNSSVVFGNHFILKLFRRLEVGQNPDLEIGAFLGARVFSHTPPLAGAMEYRLRDDGAMALAILSGFIENQGDAWTYTLEVLAQYFERVLTQRQRLQTAPPPPRPWLQIIGQEPPSLATELIGPYLESARLLGQRTAELHLALASDPDHPDFRPEPFSRLYQRSLYQSMRSLAGRVFPLLRQRLPTLSEEARSQAQQVLDREPEVLERFRSIVSLKVTAKRIRCHGDYHLGQVLFTGKDFVLIDFEGEPARSLSERRIKRSPLRDVGGMLRSFHYASAAALLCQGEHGLLRSRDRPFLQEAAGFWRLWVSGVFLKAYLETASRQDFIPRSPEEFRSLLGLYLLEKAVYELGYELNHRPEWLGIPLQGILGLLRE